MIADNTDTDLNGDSVGTFWPVRKGQALRVLLVEDDKAIGGAVRDHIAAAGHAVDWARDLATARDLRAVAAYELILLDLGLPDGRGIDRGFP